MSIKRILITKDKTSDLLRVARVDDQLLYDLEIEYTDQTQRVDQICNAEIVSIEPSLGAAFAKFDSGRNGFLPLKEIAPEYFTDKSKSHSQTSIKEALFEGQKVLVQVNKEERGTKGAALTTYITLAGCYLVLMPNNPSAGGISRRIEGDDRDAMRTILSKLRIPNGMSVIVRTAGLGKNIEELQWDLDVLLQLWDAILKASKEHGAPYLIHQESDIAIRAIRDHLKQDTAEIIIDDEEIYKKAHAFISRIRPQFLDRVKLYQKPTPLFSNFQIEKQIENAFQRKIRLPSGGEIIIDRTEALTAIDVNSARSTKGSSIEKTALHTNLEAAEEVARQLRIRDLGGLFVIDFIDMEEPEHRRLVEEKLQNALKHDRARAQTLYISRFGLMEMSRQRLRAPLSEATQINCPLCHGQGSIRSISSQGESLIYLIQEHALKEKNHKQLRVQVPVNTATYLLNERRAAIEAIEKNHDIRILIIPNPYMENPNYEIETTTKTSAHSKREVSYEMVKSPVIAYESDSDTHSKTAQKPAVEFVMPEGGPAKKAPKKKPGLIKRLIKAIFSSNKKKSKKRPNKSNYRNNNNHRRPQNNRRHPTQNRTQRSPRTNNRRHPMQSRRPASDRQNTRSTKGPTERNERTQAPRPAAEKKATAPVAAPRAKPEASKARPETPKKVESAAPRQPAPKAEMKQPQQKPVRKPRSTDKEAAQFQQVETAQKAAAISKPAAKKSAPKRAPRQRVKKEAGTQEHYEMVETKKD